MWSFTIEMMYFADQININEQTNIIFKPLKCEYEQQSIDNCDIIKKNMSFVFVSSSCHRTWEIFGVS